MLCPLALYRNQGDIPIDLRIGERPGEPPFIYAAAPGDAVEGPASYERQFVAAGFLLEKQLGMGTLKAPQGWPSAAAVVAAPVAPPSPDAEAAPAGVIIGSAPPAPDEAPIRQPKKRGG